MTCFVGLDVSQKMTAVCVVDNAGRRLWRGQCPTVPEQISILVRRHAGDNARIGIDGGNPLGDGNAVGSRLNAWDTGQFWIQWV